MKQKFSVGLGFSAFFFVALLILFGRTLFPPSGQMISGGDIIDAYYFWKMYFGTSVRSGVIPFWNPYNFSGTPFLAHPTINPLYPPNWLYIFLPLPYAFALYFFLHVFLAGVTMYWLVRQYGSAWGASAAALVYAFGGFFAARIYSGHLEYVDAASWVPLVFSLGRRLIVHSSKKNLLLSVLGMTALFLSGNELFTLFVGELLGSYFLFSLLFQKRNRMLRFLIVRVFSLCFVFLGAVGLSAVQLLPRLQFISLSLRSGGLPYSLAGTGSLPPAGLLLFVSPFFYGNPFPDAYSYSGPWPNLFEFTYSVGILPVFFFFLLVFSGFFPFLSRRLFSVPVCRERWFYSAVLLGSVLISLGVFLHPNFHELLWRYVPFYKGIRIPARHLFLSAFSLSVLTGLFVGSMRGGRLRLFILVFLFADLFLFDRKFIRLSPIPSASFDQTLIQTLTRDTTLHRVLPDFPVTSAVRRDLDFGSSSHYAFYSTSDYNSMILDDYYRFIDILNASPESSLPNYNVEIPPPDPWSPLVSFLNVKYVLADITRDVLFQREDDTYVPVLSGPRYTLYRRTHFLPRFFLVSSALPVSSQEEAARVLRDTAPDLFKTVVFVQDAVFETTVPCQESQHGEVTVLSFSAHSISLQVNTPCDQFLSTSEVYYPGWRATLDGKETHVFHSNVAFRSVFIPKGVHKIVFFYSPDIFFIGGGVSIVTAGILWVVARGRNRYDSISPIS